jgi:hypothetical protein
VRQRPQTGKIESKPGQYTVPLTSEDTEQEYQDEVNDDGMVEVSAYMAGLKRNSNVTDMENACNETRPATHSLSGTYDVKAKFGTTHSNILSPKSSMVGHGENDNSYGRSRSVLRGYSVQGDGQPPIKNINCNSSYQRIINRTYGNVKVHKPLNDYVVPKSKSHFQRHQSARAKKLGFNHVRSQQPYENIS